MLVIVFVSPGSHDGNRKRHIYTDTDMRPHSRDGSVEVSNLEDMQLVFGLYIILHGDILSRDSHHTRNILQTVLCIENILPIWMIK